MRRRVRLALLLLATLTRLWGLDAPSLWLDEAFSHAFATVTPDIAWEAMIVDGVHPPFYYLLLRPWLVLAGRSEFALRFPSALAGVLTVALVIRAGRLWLGEGAGHWAGLLLALNPFHVWYSQEARMYALFGALATAVLMAFWWALRSRTTRAWVVLALLSAFAYSTHYFALYLPLVQFVYLLITFRRHYGALVSWTVTQAAAALPLAAWLVALYTIAGGSFGIGWIPTPRPDDLLRTLWAFGMAYDGRVTPLVVIAVAVWMALLTLGVWRGPGSQRVRWLLLLSLALPPLVTFLLSLRRPAYVDRFFIAAVPPFVLLAAAGLARLPRPMPLVVGLALAGLGLWGMVRFHSDPVFVKEDWRAAAAYVEARERHGDALVLRYFQDHLPFGYYYRGGLNPEAMTLNRVTKPLSELTAGSDRLWLILHPVNTDPIHLAGSEPFALALDDRDPAISSWIAAHPPGEVRSLPGLSVMRFDLEDGPQE